MSMAERPLVLLVDDEEDLVWSVSNRLRKLRPDYRVSSHTDARVALSEIETHPIDLLITDIRMPGMTGLELIIAAPRIQKTLPVIVMTAYPTADLGMEAILSSSIEYLQKPFELDRFITLTNDVLERRKVGFSGAISVQTLPDIVLLYALSNATGALRVWRRGVTGCIWFEQGAISHALVTGTLDITGDEAFYTIMLWSGGEFTMVPGETAPERSIRASWTELLMESCKRIDDHRRSVEAQGGPTSTRGWHVGSAPANATLEMNRTEHVVVDVLLGDLEQAAHPPERPLEECNMNNIKESLTQLNDLDGFIAAALVDGESGMVLGSEDNGGGFNIEIAAATNTEVVRAKRKAIRSLGLKDDIEDILISLGKQYHLIRPLRSKGTLFFYVALDRARSNLAMSRLKVAEVEKDLQV